MCLSLRAAQRSLRGVVSTPHFSLPALLHTHQTPVPGWNEPVPVSSSHLPPSTPTPPQEGGPEQGELLTRWEQTPRPSPRGTAPVSHS